MGPASQVLLAYRYKELFKVKSSLRIYSLWAIQKLLNAWGVAGYGHFCYENLGVGAIALLLCNRHFFWNAFFLATASRLSLKSNAVCVNMYPALSCYIVKLFLLSGFMQKYQKSHLVCKINGPVMPLSQIRRPDWVVIWYMKVMGTMKYEQITKTLKTLNPT